MAKYIVIHGIRIDKDYQNFVPETFGRLTTIGPKFLLKTREAHRRTYQVCVCGCGNVVLCRRDSLATGTSSCGCLASEMAKARSQSNITHGLTRIPGYQQWKGMIQRCYNPDSISWPNYGGRGIRVCDRWRELNGIGAANFIEDVGKRPGPEYTIDRIDNDGDYCPENCRWATPKEQSRNMRSNRMLTAFGKTQCLSQWAEETGISIAAIRTRIKNGWETERVLSQVMKGKHGKT